ncbi:VOC family protein [Nocardia sp. NPDC059246]|uniref:VOC family protein n=1 Tax=unclassified Nocardia TaxID=2637762 RepID=UPI003685061B
MAFTVDRFDHVVINCLDPVATADWYARVLGMSVERFGPAGRLALTFGNQKINLRPVGALDTDPNWTTGATEAAGAQDLCFVTTAAPEAIAEHLTACGVEIVNGPVVKIGALGEMVSHYCRDLDGNLIEIAVYPS